MAEEEGSKMAKEEGRDLDLSSCILARRTFFSKIDDSMKVRKNSVYSRRQVGIKCFITSLRL